MDQSIWNQAITFSKNFDRECELGVTAGLEENLFFEGDKVRHSHFGVGTVIKAYLALGYELDALADNEIRFAFTTLMLLVQNSGNLAAYSGVDILAVLLEHEIFVDGHIMPVITYLT